MSIRKAAIRLLTARKVPKDGCDDLGPFDGWSISAVNHAVRELRRFQECQAALYPPLERGPNMQIKAKVVAEQVLKRAAPLAEEQLRAAIAVLAAPEWTATETLSGLLRVECRLCDFRMSVVEMDGLYHNPGCPRLAARETIRAWLGEEI